MLTREMVIKDLHGVKFPVDKTSLIQYAKESMVSEDIIGILNELPEREYTGYEDIAEGVDELDFLM